MVLPQRKVGYWTFVSPPWPRPEGKQAGEYSGARRNAHTERTDGEQKGASNYITASFITSGSP
jgi:hypothetical protein